jgi:hypothetical protein
MYKLSSRHITLPLVATSSDSADRGRSIIRVSLIVNIKAVSVYIVGFVLLDLYNGQTKKYKNLKIPTTQWPNEKVQKLEDTNNTMAKRKSTKT